MNFSGAIMEIVPSGSEQPGLHINWLLYTFDVTIINDTFIE